MTDSEKDILIRKKLIKAGSFLDETKNLICLKYYETSVNRIYYACFYCVQALLARMDIYPKSHKGCLTMFNRHFVKDGQFSKNLGQFYQEIFDQRITADYDDDFDVSETTIDNFLTTALRFIQHTEALLQKK
jgi:uncharacterized protein (UPF0332 family)